MIRNPIRNPAKNLLSNMIIGQGGGATPWTPEQIFTFNWYDASDESTITDIAGAVSQIDDLSGNDNHATQPNAGEQPTTGTRAINGLNGLDFSGTNQALDFPETEGVGKEFYAVCAQDFDNGDRQVISSSSVNKQLRIQDGFVSASGVNFPYVTDFVMTIQMPVTQPGIVEYIMGPILELGLDGNIEVGPFLNPAPQPFLLNQIGKRAASANEFNGIMGEIIIKPFGPPSERQLVEGYLAWKWGLVEFLPDAHPYKNSPPTV